LNKREIIRKKLRYSLADIILPCIKTKNHENFKIFYNFQRWVDSALSIDVILNKIMQIDIIKENYKEIIEFNSRSNDNLNYSMKESLSVIEKEITRKENFINNYLK
jgi:hypothetical protein